MLDAELIEQLRLELPGDIGHVMISSVSGLGLEELKDKLWRKLQIPLGVKAPSRTYDGPVNPA
jgi:hypothetical protein